MTDTGQSAPSASSAVSATSSNVHLPSQQELFMSCLDMQFPASLTAAAVGSNYVGTIFSPSTSGGAVPTSYAPSSSLLVGSYLAGGGGGQLPVGGVNSSHHLKSETRDAVDELLAPFFPLYTSALAAADISSLQQQQQQQQSADLQSSVAAKAQQPPPAHQQQLVSGYNPATGSIFPAAAYQLAAAGSGGGNSSATTTYYYPVAAAAAAGQAAYAPAAAAAALDSLPYTPGYYNGYYLAPASAAAAVAAPPTVATSVANRGGQATNADWRKSTAAFNQTATSAGSQQQFGGQPMNGGYHQQPRSDGETTPGAHASSTQNSINAAAAAAAANFSPTSYYFSSLFGGQAPAAFVGQQPAQPPSGAGVVRPSVGHYTGGPDMYGGGGGGGGSAPTTFLIPHGGGGGNHPHQDAQAVAAAAALNNPTAELLLSISRSFPQQPQASAPPQQQARQRPHPQQQMQNAAADASLLLEQDTIDAVLRSIAGGGGQQPEYHTQQPQAAHGGQKGAPPKGAVRAPPQPQPASGHDASAISRSIDKVLHNVLGGAAPQQQPQQRAQAPMTSAAAAAALAASINRVAAPKMGAVQQQASGAPQAHRKAPGQPQAPPPPAAEPAPPPGPTAAELELQRYKGLLQQLIAEKLSLEIKALYCVLNRPHQVRDVVRRVHAFEIERYLGSLRAAADGRPDHPFDPDPRDLPPAPSSPQPDSAPLSAQTLSPSMQMRRPTTPGQTAVVIGFSTTDMHENDELVSFDGVSPTGHDARQASTSAGNEAMQVNGSTLASTTSREADALEPASSPTTMAVRATLDELVTASEAVLIATTKLEDEEPRLLSELDDLVCAGIVDTLVEDVHRAAPEYASPIAGTTQRVFSERTLATAQLGGGIDSRKSKEWFAKVEELFGQLDAQIHIISDVLDEAERRQLAGGGTKGRAPPTDLIEHYKERIRALEGELEKVLQGEQLERAESVVEQMVEELHAEKAPLEVKETLPVLQVNGTGTPPLALESPRVETKLKALTSQIQCDTTTQMIISGDFMEQDDDEEERREEPPPKRARELL